MDVARFSHSPVGALAPLSGIDGRTGEEYSHYAFIPDPLPSSLELGGQTWQAVARANYALGMLRQGEDLVPNPGILRRPSLRREAQSTSALEGTFAPLEDVLAADMVDSAGHSQAMREILNYIQAAEYAFDTVSESALTVSLLCGLHQILVAGTESDGPEAGRIRSIPVAIGARGGSIYDARFVPPPPGLPLDAAVRDLVAWVGQSGDRAFDPVVAAALGHYQFETLHPFNDGNGRIGRLLIVLQLIRGGVLTQPLLTVSPWLEARREVYQESLAEVSASGDWDQWVRFFAEGVAASADETANRLRQLLEVQRSLHRRLQDAHLRGVSRDIVDLIIGDPFVNVPHLARATGKTYQAISNAVHRLEELGVLEQVPGIQPKLYRAPDVLRILIR